MTRVVDDSQQETEWEAFLPDLNQKKQDLVDLRVECGSILETVKEAHTNYKKARASIDATTRYKDTVESKYFKAKGVMPALANLGSRMLLHSANSFTPLPRATEWDASRACYLGYFEPVTKIVSYFEAGINTKLGEIIQLLGSPEGRQHRGLYKIVPYTYDGDDESVEAFIEGCDALPTKPYKLQTFGVSANIIRGYTMRTNNQAFPFWSQGCFIQSKLATICITIVDLGKMNEACEMVNLDKFEGAFSSRKVMAIKWPTVSLTPGEVVWIPFGSAPLITTTQDYAHFVYVPYLPVHLPNVDPVVTELVYTNFAKFLKQNLSRKPWSALSGPYQIYRTSQKPAEEGAADADPE